MDAVAATIADQAVTITQLRGQIAQLQQENATLRSQLPEPPSDAAPAGAKPRTGDKR